MLESLDPAIANDLVANGIQSTTLTSLDVWERPIFCLRLSENAPYTKYPFSLLVGQHTVERIMREHLARKGHRVQYGRRVTDLQHCPEGWALDLEGGQRVTARYVVAADGSKSFVCRHAISEASGC